MIRCSVFGPCFDAILASVFKIGATMASVVVKPRPQGVGCMAKDVKSEVRERPTCPIWTGSLRAGPVCPGCTLGCLHGLLCLINWSSFGVPLGPNCVFADPRCIEGRFFSCRAFFIGFFFVFCRIVFVFVVRVALVPLVLAVLSIPAPFFSHCRLKKSLFRVHPS